MDRASDGLDPKPMTPIPPTANTPWWPQDRASVVALVVRGDDLLDENEPELALTFYTAAAGVPDRDIAAVAHFGAGNALYRLDREAEATQAWQRATSFGETPIAYRAWRQVAAAFVREGDLEGALRAYRECERRAPREDRAEIASRLGWLSKETGKTGEAGRYFARSRNDALPLFMTYGIIAVTVVVSLVAGTGGRDTTFGYIPSPLLQQLELDKIAIAHGDYYRLLSVVLVHDPTDIFHLLFNMYALWFAGLLVEKMYGAWLTLVFYCVCGVGGSIGTYVFGDAVAGVGASGAIFGFFGIILVATQLHHPILDAQSRAIASQIGILIVLNLVLGFSGVFNVDNFAHLGGLVTGLWLGLLLPPSQVATLGSLWQGTRPGTSPGTVVAARTLGLVALGVVLFVGLLIGNDQWGKYPVEAASAAPAAHAVVVPQPGAAFELVGFDLAG